MKPDSAIEIIQKLRTNGFEAYLVGGCVRDMLMGIEPADYDIATSAHPEQLVGLFPRTESIGAQFGVVLVIYRGHPFEVATFRSDDAYVDGRRPTRVTFTDAKQDVLRRDFTINGLLYDPIDKRVIDHVSGQEDIGAKIVRAIGDPSKRFAEDKLRMLRAIRFGARLGYEIEPMTWNAVCEMASQIHQVSSERIRYELVRILTEGQAARGIRLLEESGLRREVLPELQWTSHLDACLRIVQAQAEPDFATAVLLHELVPSQVQNIVERLKFSRSEMHHIVALVESLPMFLKIRDLSVSALKRFFRSYRFEDYLELERIHAAAEGGDASAHQYAAKKYLGWSRDEISPKLLITGEDLIAMGFQPGPAFKEILTRVEDEQLEGHLVTKEDATGFITKTYRN
jgi:poly(A) polymerase